MADRIFSRGVDRVVIINQGGFIFGFRSQSVNTGESERESLVGNVPAPCWVLLGMETKDGWKYIPTHTQAEDDDGPE